MIIVMKPGAPLQECEKIKNGLIDNGFQINEIVGVNMTILGVIGDTSTLDINLLRVNDWVEKVMRVQEPFKRANRMFHPEDSVIDVNGIKIGGKKSLLWLGPVLWKQKSRSFPWLNPLNSAGRHCCAAALSSRVLLPIPSRG